MSWRDLLVEKEAPVVAPWIGGRSVCLGTRTWTIQGKLPQEHGWFTFRVTGRTVELAGPAERPTEALYDAVTGFLVGDRLVVDSANVDPDPQKIVAQSERLHLLDLGVGRFTRVRGGRFSPDGPFFFLGETFPLGPEPEVQVALEDGLRLLTMVRGVPPALEAAFRMELFQRDEAEKRRVEAERRRQEEEAKRAEEARRVELVRQLGDGAGRRAMAAYDFGAAARAALAVGGATYLDHRAAHRPNERAVRFRLDGRRFECTCDARTLQIIDAGICLTAHYDDVDFEGGTKGDTFFTLESLPSVIRQAAREDKLVVYRHVE